MNAMSDEKTELCLEVLSAVAWADADLSIDEVAKAVELLEPMDYANRHRIEEIFMMPRCLPPVKKLEMLSPDELLRLILDAHCVARHFKGILPHEMKLLHVLHELLAQKDVSYALLPKANDPGVGAVMKGASHHASS